MFTKEQIETAHNKVKSGADFPNFIKEIISMGVKSYEVILIDGIWVFKGEDDYAVTFNRGLNSINVSTTTYKEKFKEILSIHQKGGTDFDTFCIQAGECGVERWICDLKQMTITYVDLKADVIYSEMLPVFA